MSDWDFLHEMHAAGYSADDIADAAGSGAAPWEWEYINKKWLDDQLNGVSMEVAKAVTPVETNEGYPLNILVQTAIFHDLIDCAVRHFENTGRYLQVWGELGEIYAEIRYGLRRHSTHSPGSDGTIAGKLVEVKTISPEKSSDSVRVKSQGDFDQLLIVRINSRFEFQSKFFKRGDLKGDGGRFLRGRF